MDHWRDVLTYGATSKGRKGRGRERRAGKGKGGEGGPWFLLTPPPDVKSWIKPWKEDFVLMIVTNATDYMGGSDEQGRPVDDEKLPNSRDWRVYS